MLSMHTTLALIMLSMLNHLKASPGRQLGGARHRSGCGHYGPRSGGPGSSPHPVPREQPMAQMLAVIAATAGLAGLYIAVWAANYRRSRR